MLAWKVAPALAPAIRWCSNRRKTHRSRRWPLPSSAPKPAAAGRGQHRHRRWRTGALIVNHGHRQDRLHRFHRGRPHHPPGHGGSGKKLRWSWAANRPSSCSTMPISTAPSKAWSTPSGSTRARSAAPARACWCRSRSPTAFMPSSRRAPASCAWAIRWTSPPTSAPWCRRCSCSASVGWLNKVVPKAANAGNRTARYRQGFYFPPTLFTGVSPAATIAQEKSSAGAGQHHVPHA